MKHVLCNSVNTVSCMLNIPAAAGGVGNITGDYVLSVAGWRQSTKVSFCSPRCTSHYTTPFTAAQLSWRRTHPWLLAKWTLAEAARTSNSRSYSNLAFTFTKCVHCEAIRRNASLLHVFSAYQTLIHCSLTCCYAALSVGTRGTAAR